MLVPILFSVLLADIFMSKDQLCIDKSVYARQSVVISVISALTIKNVVYKGR